jgi:hypothetical protein
MGAGDLGFFSKEISVSTFETDKEDLFKAMESEETLSGYGQMFVELYGRKGWGAHSAFGYVAGRLYNDLYTQIEASTAIIEECAKAVDDLNSDPQQLKLHMGEMSAQELRNASVLMRLIAFKLRCLKSNNRQRQIEEDRRSDERTAENSTPA